MLVDKTRGPFRGRASCVGAVPFASSCRSKRRCWKFRVTGASPARQIQAKEADVLAAFRKRYTTTTRVTFGAAVDFSGGTTISGHSTASNSNIDQEHNKSNIKVAVVDAAQSASRATTATDICGRVNTLVNIRDEDASKATSRHTADNHASRSKISARNTRAAKKTTEITKNTAKGNADTNATADICEAPTPLDVGMCVEVQFTGPQPSEGPAAMLLELLRGASIQAQPVSLRRGRRKKSVPDIPSASPSKSDNRCVDGSGDDPSEASTADGSTSDSRGPRLSDTTEQLNNDDRYINIARAALHRQASQASHAQAGNEEPAPTLAREIGDTPLAPLPEIFTFSKQSPLSPHRRGSARTDSCVSTSDACPATGGPTRMDHGVGHQAIPSLHARGPQLPETENSTVESHNCDLFFAVDDDNGISNVCHVGSNNSGNSIDNSIDNSSSEESVVHDDSLMHTGRVSDGNLPYELPLLLPQALKPFMSELYGTGDFIASVTSSFTDANDRLARTISDEDSLSPPDLEECAGEGNPTGNVGGRISDLCGRKILATEALEGRDRVVGSDVTIDQLVKECDFDGRPVWATNVANAYFGATTSCSQQGIPVFRCIHFNNQRRADGPPEIVVQFRIGTRSVRKAAAPVQAGANHSTYAAVSYPSMKELWPEVYYTKNIREIKVDMVVEMRSAGDLLHVDHTLKVLYRRARATFEGAGGSREEHNQEQRVGDLLRRVSTDSTDGMDPMQDEGGMFF